MNWDLFPSIAPSNSNTIVRELQFSHPFETASVGAFVCVSVCILFKSHRQFPEMFDKS